MKIKRLELKAYGHFSDCLLDFDSPTPGLHIVYGPNEAGKSTTLRALHGLFYGIPVRTADNFRYDYSRLLIGGSLVSGAGKELSFWRRKKNIGDLLDADQSVLDEKVLADFLQGIEEPLFKALFGIDHETLVSGGRDILEQKGDIGQALFSAGAGLSSLHGMIADMDKECDALFKPGGSRPELNQAIKAYQDLKKEIRTLVLTASAWKEQQDIFDSTSEQLRLVEQQKGVASAELERLKRLQRALPHLVKRSLVQKQLARLGDFRHLPLDFSRRFREVMELQKQIEKTLQEAGSRKETLVEKKNRISFRQDLLDHSETVDDLHQRLGAQRQAAKDRPEIYSRLISSRTEVETLLNQVAPALGLSQMDKVKSLLSQSQAIVTLGNRFAGIDHDLKQSAGRVSTLKHELETIDGQLELAHEVGDLRNLAATITLAQRAGDIDGTLQSLERDITGLLAAAGSMLKALGLAQDNSEKFLSLPLPLSATIDTFVESYRAAREDIEHNQKQHKKTREELERLHSAIKALEKAGEVPTDEDLLQARTRRDYGWQLIKRVWLGGEALELEARDYDGTADLPEAFENGIHHADAVADHLRTAAERVHQYASLRSEVERAEAQMEQLAQEGIAIKQRQQQLDQQWQLLWKDCGLVPRSPREMRPWLDQCHEAGRVLREARHKESNLQPLREQQQALCTALITALGELGYTCSVAPDRLTPVLVYAEQLGAELKGKKEQYQQLLNDKRRCEKNLTESSCQWSAAQRARADWSTRWRSALEGVGLPADISVDDAAKALDTLRTCLNKSTQIAGFEQRIRDIDQHVQDFDAAVRILVRSIAPELGVLPPEQAVVKLQSMVREAEKNKSILEKLAEDLDLAEENIRQAKVARQQMEMELHALCELARCSTTEGLIEVDAHFCEHQNLQQQLASLEQTLVGVAEGVDLEDLEQQRRTVDPNELPGLLAALERNIQRELDPCIKELSEKKGAARNELQKMDGRSLAAILEDEAQMALARVRRLADRYLRVRLASRLLKTEIERYRREHQDPILKLASAYFSQLTIGAFPGLRSDFDDNSNPILVGVCPDGSTRGVEAMSSGTRDQLYLALRLATLEWRLEKHEPMPFIADDILVNFDDVRSEATLKALATLAQKNQVILFTHHQQIVKTVEALKMEGHVVVHSLADAFRA